MNMNRIISAVKLDFFAARSFLKMSLVYLAVSILIGLSARQPLFSASFVMVFAVFLGGTVFSAHEKSRSDRLYGVLPLGRAEMIAGRYIYALIIGAINVIVAGIVAFELSLMLNASLDLTAFLTVLALSFFYYCFAVGVSYPIYFKYTFTKAYAFTMLPMYFIALFSIFVARRTGILNHMDQIGDFFSANQWLIPVTGLLAGLALLLASAAVANIIYTRKEI